MEFHNPDPKYLIELCPLKAVLTFDSDSSDLERRLQLWLFPMKNSLRFPPDKLFMALYISIADDWIFFWWIAKDLSLTSKFSSEVTVSL